MGRIITRLGLSNYAPDASKGALKWEKAKERYYKLGCGKHAAIRRKPGQVELGEPLDRVSGMELRRRWRLSAQLLGWMNRSKTQT